jgi:hypothetical protein
MPSANPLSLRGGVTAGVPETSRLFIPHRQELEDVRRLVVLVPESGLRPGWWAPLFERLNVPEGIEIVLVAQERPGHEEKPDRRRLNGLVSSLRVSYPRATGYTIARSDWVSALQGLTSSHDLLVCFPELQAGDGLANRQALSQRLFDALDLPVIEVSGASPPIWMRLWAPAGRALFQVFPFAVVALFFWLQIQINQQTHGLVYHIALGASAVVEIGVIFVWSLFLD